MKTSIYNIRRAAWCLALFPFLSALPAETLVYEGFDIPPGTGALHEASGATSFGWDGPWHSDPGSSGGNVSFNVAAQGLAYDGATGGFGGAMQVANGLEGSSGNYYIGNVNSHFRNLDRSYSEGELWFGFLAKPSVRIEGGPGGFFQVMLTSRSFFYGGDGRHLGVGANGWGDIMWMVGGHLVHGEISSPYSMLAGNLVFMVVRVDFDNQQVSMWANPDAAVSDPGSPIWTLPLLTNDFGEGLLEVSRIAIFDASHRTSGNVRDYSGTLIDQIRLGTTYASVVPRDGEEAMWYDYPVTDSWVDTGDWMDRINVANDPWLYSPALGWMALGEMHSTGAWVYKPRQQ